MRWARLLGVAGCGLRRGAWYPVAAVSATEVQVHVRGRITRVPRALLELRDRPPGEWTVVPAGAREGYVVCPNCRTRESLPDLSTRLVRCPRCNEAFPVGWAVTAAPVDTLRKDLRMTRRRRARDRRGSERREATRRTVTLVVSEDRRVAERRADEERRAAYPRRYETDRRRKATVW